jgi:parallel beta-helix repeat protein
LKLGLCFAVFFTVALLLTLSSFPVSVAVQADFVFINEDGTVSPEDAPIQQEGRTYYLTGSIRSIGIEISNVIFDGQGCCSIAQMFCWSLENVTIKNLSVDGGDWGICLYYCTNCTITNCTIKNTQQPIPFQIEGGIIIEGGVNNKVFANNITNNLNGFNMFQTSGNWIFENNITDSRHYGFWFFESSNNTFYHNNVINNTNQAGSSGNVWDFNGEGNFWGDYNGTDVNGDGVGDTPYVISGNEQDNYPLMVPYHKPQPTPTPSPTPSLTTTPIPNPTISSSPISTPVTSLTPSPTPTITPTPTASPTESLSPQPTETPLPELQTWTIALAALTITLIVTTIIKKRKKTARTFFKPIIKISVAPKDKNQSCN